MMRQAMTRLMAMARWSGAALWWASASIRQPD
jgi:hypothetical protein